MKAATRRRGPPHRILLLIGAIATVVLVVQSVAVFLTLGVSGFWIDELFTLDVTAQPAFDETIRRILSDVHLPLYYLLIHGWGSLFGFGEVALRAFSGICAVLMLAAIVVLTAPWMRLAVRLLTAGVATGTTIWFEQAQNARMYALGLLLTTLAAILLLRLVEEARCRAVAPRTLALFGGTTTVLALDHPYMSMIAIFLCVIASAAMHRRRDRFILAALATSLLALVALYYVIARTYWIFDPARSWFALRDIGRSEIIRRALVAMLPPVTFTAIMLGTVAWTGRWRPIRPRDIRTVGIVILLGIVAATIVGGLVTSRLMSPNLSERNIDTLSPLVWLAFGLALDLCLDRTRPWVGTSIVLWLAGLLIAQTVFLLPQRWLRHGEAIREAARFVDRQPGCAGMPIPILLHRRSAVRGNGATVQRRVLGYYLARTDAMLPPIDRSDDHAEPLAATTRAIVAARAGGDAPCRVIAVQFHDSFPQSEAVRLLSRWANGSHSIAVRGFDAISYEDWHVQTHAWVFLRGPPTARKTDRSPR